MKIIKDMICGIFGHNIKVKKNSYGTYIFCKTCKSITKLPKNEEVIVIEEIPYSNRTYIR